VPSDSFKPSGKQIWDHVAWAIEALEAGVDYTRFITDKHDDLAFDLLGVSEMPDVLDWVLVFLREIRDLGPQNCFIYHGWVDRSYEPDYEGLPLFPFVFESSHFPDKEIYLKFGVLKTNDAATPHLYCHLDLHESHA
jgi:hypothetical protein